MNKNLKAAQEPDQESAQVKQQLKPTYRQGNISEMQVEPEVPGNE